VKRNFELTNLASYDVAVVTEYTLSSAMIITIVVVERLSKDVLKFFFQVNDEIRTQGIRTKQRKRRKPSTSAGKPPPYLSLIRT
jgi:hypothetical protein